MLNALPEQDVYDNTEQQDAFLNLNLQTDATEKRIEAKEVPKYLKAKALFDCHEFLRCAAVFLPSSFFEVQGGPSQGRDKNEKKKPYSSLIKRISQKGLFIALYALLIAGEKSKAEEQGRLLGVSDIGTNTNKYLPQIRRVLAMYFNGTHTDNPERCNSQGWIEYLLSLPPDLEANLEG